MPVYNVAITGADGTPGTIQVNASDPEAAKENAKQGGNTPTGDAQQVAANPNAQTSSVNYTAPGAGTPANQGTPGADQYGAAIQKLMDALASGNREAFNRAVYEWDQTFGFEKTKFAEDTRRFNQTFGLQEAGVTGTYQGHPTLAAQGQYFTQGLQGITLASQMQANPFRQQQVLGQLGNLYGGQGVAGFSAPNTVAGVGTAGGNTQGGLGYMQQMIDDIKSPGANQTSMNQVLQGTPTPNKLNSVDFLRSAPSTQSMVLQAMQEKYGIDPNDALTQIKATLPSFQAPTTMGTVKR